jgi:hypothetical protein
MYVIFYNNKPIYLSDNTPNCDNLKSFDFKDIDIFKILNQLKNDTLKGVCLIGDKPLVMFKKLIHKFKLIEAAGGLVYNDKKELLFIFRDGVWDLPKGKIEKSEKTAEAALREVEEECGIVDLQLGDFIDKTYHIYQFKNQPVFKITHWYKMTSNQCTELVPQLEEGITKAVFLDKNGQEKALQNTYPNIKMLIDTYNLSLQPLNNPQ